MSFKAQIQSKRLVPSKIIISLFALFFIASCSDSSSPDNTEQAKTSTESSQSVAEDDTDVDSIVETTEQAISNGQQETPTEQKVMENDPSDDVSTEKEPEIEAVTAEPEVITFVEGKKKDYVTKFPAEEPKEPILVEFFSFWCPHCYNFEPTVNRWLDQKPDAIKLVKVPVVFGRDEWRLTAKAYYIAEELDLTDVFVPLMFQSIHVKKINPKTDEDIGKLFLELGISAKKFKETANSFNVDSKLRKAEYLTKKYKVSGVPYFLINYKYEAGEASYASQEALFKLWNNLPTKDFN